MWEEIVGRIIDIENDLIENYPRCRTSDAVRSGLLKPYAPHRAIVSDNDAAGGMLGMTDNPLEDRSELLWKCTGRNHFTNMAPNPSVDILGRCRAEEPHKGQYRRSICTSAKLKKRRHERRAG